MKKIRLASLLLMLVVLTGCLTPSIDVVITPNPIEITSGQEMLEGIKLEFKMRGFSFSYALDQVLVTLTDHDGTERVSKEFNLNKKIPVFSGVSHRENLAPISLGEIGELASEVYDAALKGKEWQLEVVVVGTKTSTARAAVQFK